MRNYNEHKYEDILPVSIRNRQTIRLCVCDNCSWMLYLNHAQKNWNNDNNNRSNVPAAWPSFSVSIGNKTASVNIGLFRIDKCLFLRGRKQGLAGGDGKWTKKKNENAIFMCVKHREYISVKNIINKNDGNSVSATSRVSIWHF